MNASKTIAALLLLLGLNSLALNAHGAGMMTHAMSAEEGIEHLPKGALRAVLENQLTVVISGATFPDGGYAAPGLSDLAEHAHWGEFLNDFVEYIRFDANGGNGCDVAGADTSYVFGETVDLSAECQQLIAFMMGAKAHGIGDETWDRLFEDEIRRLGENPSDPAGDSPTGQLIAQFGGGVINTIEYSLDMVLIHEQSRQDDTPKDLPPTLPTALVAVYDKAGKTYTEADMIQAAGVTQAATAAEVSNSANESQRVKMDMPWASGRYFNHPGGVTYLSKMIGHMYLHIWNKLIEPVDMPVPPEIVATWPEHGDTNIRWNFRELHNHNGDWGRVYAYFGNAALAESVRPAGTFCVFDEEGNRIPGSSNTGPYGPNSDIAHTMFFTPEVDFKPNTRYYVVLTAGIRDRRGASPLRNYTWSFETGAEQAEIIVASE